MTHRTNISMTLLLLLVGSTAGCALWHKRALPERNEIVLDQLVIHSETPLPKNHRLLAELAAQRMTQVDKLGLPVSDEAINIYLFPSEDRFNEFMRANFPGLPDRRAFFIESDTKLAVYAYWGDRVAEDLRHEVAHGYLHAVVPHLPLWLDEGLAEYFEVARGHRGLNAPHVQELKQALASGWHPDLRRLERIDNAADLTAMDYAESWAWVHFLLETTPERKQFLQGYLAMLLKHDSAESLSHQLRRLHLDYERQLVDYLGYLGQRLE